MKVLAHFGWIATVLLVTSCSAQPATSAAPSSSTGGATVPTGIPADADPQLAAIYRDVVQKDMPGLPFSILEGAKREGKVTWYHVVTPAAHGPAIAEFKKRFPFIEVAEFEATGGPVLERLMTEKRAGTNVADVFQTTSPSLIQQAVDAGYIDSYKLTSEAKFKAGTFAAGTWYATSVSTLNVYIYNTNLVNEAQAKALEKYEGLYDPALKGLTIGLPPITSGAGPQALYYYFYKELGPDSWNKLKATKYKIYDVIPSADAVARGEIAVASVGESVANNQWIAKAPVRWTVPRPATSAPFPQAVVKNAPHPNAARLLQEFLLSQVGQVPFATFAYPSGRTDVGELRPVAKESWFPAQRSYYAIDQAAFDKQMPSLIDAWKQLFNP